MARGTGALTPLIVRLLFILLFALALTARAADAPYVTTPDNVIEAMLKLGAVTADDFVMDLGSGDGRIVITAAKTRRARGQGIELDPNLVRQSAREAERQGVAGRVTFTSDDLFFADLSKATVVTMYMSAPVNQRLRPSLFKLKPGTRVLSHDFDMGNWRPDQKVTVSVPGKTYGAPHSNVFLWVIPADFAGTWRWQGDGKNVHEAALEQTFQRINATGQIDGRSAALGKIDVRGDTIRLVMAVNAVQREYRGRISGDTISGTAVTIGATDEDKATQPWRATRVARGRINIEAETQSFGSGSGSSLESSSGFSTKE